MLDYILTLSTLVVVGVVLAASLNLVQGYSGIMSVSHGAFMGVGAYVLGVLSTQFGVDSGLAMVAGAVAAGLVGWLFMTLAAQLDSDDFILASFALQMVVVDLFTQWTPVTHGSYGLFGIPRPTLFGFQLNNLLAYALFVLLLGALSWAVLAYIADSTFGVVLRGMRESYRSVEAVGKNVLSTQISTFAVSAAFAGLAGGIYATSIGLITPGDFDIRRSILAVAFLLVGGIGNMAGAAIGAVALLILPELVKQFGSIPTQWQGPGQQIVYGIVIVLFVWLRPQGIIAERSILRFGKRQFVSNAGASVSPPAPTEARGNAGPDLPPNAPLLETRGITTQFGGLVALEDVSLQVPTGTITALIGPNGAGKSTLVNVISGFQRPTGGRVRFRQTEILGRRPHEIVHQGLVRSFQSLEVFGKLTAAENLALAVPDQTSDSIFGLFLHPIRVRRERRTLVHNVEAVLARLNLSAYADELAENLSYGIQKQVIVGRLLASRADLLIFDEPGAGLPRSAVEELGALLRTLVERDGATILLIDHNMELVLNFADLVYVLHAGHVIVSGTPGAIRDNQQVLDVYLSRTDRAVRSGGTRASDDEVYVTR